MFVPVYSRIYRENKVAMTAKTSQNEAAIILVFKMDTVDTGSVCVKYPWLAYMVL